MGQDPREGQPPSSRRKENFKEWYPWIVQAAGLVDKVIARSSHSPSTRFNSDSVSMRLRGADKLF